MKNTPSRPCVNAEVYRKSVYLYTVYNRTTFQQITEIFRYLINDIVKREKQSNEQIHAYEYMLHYMDKCTSAKTYSLANNTRIGALCLYIDNNYKKHTYSTGLSKLKK